MFLLITLLYMTMASGYNTGVVCYWLRLSRDISGLVRPELLYGLVVDALLLLIMTCAIIFLMASVTAMSIFVTVILYSAAIIFTFGALVAILMLYSEAPPVD